MRMLLPHDRDMGLHAMLHGRRPDLFYHQDKPVQAPIPKKEKVLSLPDLEHKETLSSYYVVKPAQAVPATNPNVDRVGTVARALQDMHDAIVTEPLMETVTKRGKLVMQPYSAHHAKATQTGYVLVGSTTDQ